MKSGRLLLASLAGLALAACGDSKPAAPAAATPAAPAGPAAGSLQWAIGGDWRLDAVKARDVWRHPAETLAFFGVRPSDTVIEIWPGGGYWTAILGPWLKAGGGKLIAAETDAPEAVDTWKAVFTKDPARYGDIVVTTASKTAPNIADDNTADVVLTFRNIHNWMSGGYADKIFADAFRALKPGGILGIEEHRLPSSKDQDLMAKTGYVSEAYVKQLAEKAGFTFEGSSEINANKKDNADHPLGVWMLPPTLRAPKPGTPEAAAYNVEEYKAIGESDRMTLKFRKPGPTAEPPPAAPAPTPAPAAPPKPN